MAIVSIFGPNNIGKSTLARILKRRLGSNGERWIIDSLAAPIKQQVANELFYGQRPFPEGYDYLPSPHNETSHPCPTLLNSPSELEDIMFDRVTGLEAVKESLRPLMLEVGADQIKKHGKYYYPDRLIKTYGLNSGHRVNLIIDDCRFPAELERLSALPTSFNLCFVDIDGSPLLPPQLGDIPSDRFQLQIPEYYYRDDDKGEAEIKAIVTDIRPKFTD